MITPINGHLLIELVEHEEFISSTKSTYEEKGKVLAIAQDVLNFPEKREVKINDIVYFDSWLSARYPKGDKDFYWLVKYEDIRAYEKVSE